jgi:hypothetical protein
MTRRFAPLAAKTTVTSRPSRQSERQPAMLAAAKIEERMACGQGRYAIEMLSSRFASYRHLSFRMHLK